ncbi:MAG: phosphonate ABC transporter ATP-binding protein [Stappiaceae bacterium]
MRTTAIHLSNVYKSFVSHQAVLKGIDLTIEPGEMVALIGASGSGKSTLIRSVSSLELIDKHTEGRISLFDQPVQLNGRTTAYMRSMRRNVGVIFQQFNLVSRLSLLTNVLAGRLGRMSGWRGLTGQFSTEDRIKALQALERVGMAEYAHQRASTLSGGQQQRGAIARALCQEARLILADEPIASLDPASAEIVMTMLCEINQKDGTTVVVSLHQIDHAFKHFKRIVALKDGAVIYDGPVAQIGQDDLAGLYGLEEGALALPSDKRDGGTKAPGPKAIIVGDPGRFGGALVANGAAP